MNEKEIGKIVDWHIIRRIYGFIQPYKIRFWFLVLLILGTASVSPVIPLMIRFTLDNYVSLGHMAELLQQFMLMILVLLVQTSLQFSTSYLAGFLGQTERWFDCVTDRHAPSLARWVQLHHCRP
jgi:ATP-binding cassette subfamily B protein